MPSRRGRPEEQLQLRPPLVICFACWRGMRPPVLVASLPRRVWTVFSSGRFSEGCVTVNYCPSAGTHIGHYILVCRTYLNVKQQITSRPVIKRQSEGRNTFFPCALAREPRFKTLFEEQWRDGRMGQEVHSLLFNWVSNICVWNAPVRLQKLRGVESLRVRAAALETRKTNPATEIREANSSNIQAGRDEEEILKRQRLFNRIAPVYDNLNDWLSLGLHRVWKRMSVSWSGAQAGDTVLDICCGSGDVSFLLAEKVGSKGKVSGLDFAAEQLSIAASRQQDSAQKNSLNIEWIQGDALALPFEDESFDAITMGYGLRNVADIPQALGEICRVLKSGCKASILDFNRSPNPVTDGVQSWMLDNVVVPVATYLGVEEEYAYLKTSIARFPLGTEQERLAEDAGFCGAVHYELGAGLMGVLVVTK